MYVSSRASIVVCRQPSRMQMGARDVTISHYLLGHHVTKSVAGVDMAVHVLSFFFFQAEDGIRDLTVTGVQTCALPIWPFFLNNWVPREGIGRDEYLTAKFGSPEAYKGIAGRVVAAANEEGLLYRPELVKRQPNTTDCHRLIHWAEAQGKSADMKQRLMELHFRDGGDLTDTDVLVQAAADCGLH